MGLDNGLILHSKRLIPSEARPVPTISFMGMDEKTNDWPLFDYEICYWRKCWNIRREVAHALGLSLDYVQKYDLDIGDVKNIWRIINSFNSAAAWDNDDSIWTYKEIHDHLDNDLAALEWLIYFMRNHKEDEYTIEFYDSY